MSDSKDLKNIFSKMKYNLENMVGRLLNIKPESDITNQEVKDYVEQIREFEASMYSERFFKGVFEKSRIMAKKGIINKIYPRYVPFFHKDESQEDINIIIINYSRRLFQDSIDILILGYLGKEGVSLSLLRALGNLTIKRSENQDIVSMVSKGVSMKDITNVFRFEPHSVEIIRCPEREEATLKEFIYS